MTKRVTLAVIGDVHHQIDLLDKVVDRLTAESLGGVLLVGDLGRDLPFGVHRTERDRDAHQESVERVVAVMQRLNVTLLWVPGNHDLPNLEGAGNVDGKVMELAGLRVGGIGGSGPNRFGFPYEWDEEDIRKRTLDPCDILLSHTPPLDTPLDLTHYGGRHAGSLAVRERAQAHDGVLVCGHIHEAAGSVQLGRCLCLNAGSLGEPFGKPQVAFIDHDPNQAGLWTVRHEDLVSGATSTWTRSEP